MSALAAQKFLTIVFAEKEFRKRLLLLNDFINVYFDTNTEEINRLLVAELKNAIEAKSIDMEAMIRFMIAYSAFEKGDSAKALLEFKNVTNIFPQVTDPIVRAQILNFFAFNQSHQGNYDKAIEYAYECIRESERTDHPLGRLWGIYSLGVIHFDLKDFSNAEKFYGEAAKGFAQYSHPYGLARSETGLASIFMQQGAFEKAETLLVKSLNYYKEIEVLSGQSRVLNDLGVIATKTGRLDKALEYYKQALKIRKDTQHVQGMTTTLNEIAELLISMKKYVEAGEYLNEAQITCERINNKTKLYRTHYLYSQLYRNTNEPWKSLEHYEKYDQLRSEVVGQTANNKIKELQTKAATEKAEKEKEIERLRNVELRSAYDIIELKNKEITDSIQYAQRIQKALLASDGMLRKNLKDFFVLYQPKDIVSGDFYWAVEKNGRFYLAVCDSTGHGVPGAFMSLLNISFLNEAISEKNISTPGSVFDHARKRLIENISTEGGRDGMDGILVCIENGKLSYAAAHNAPFLVRNGTIEELDADKMPIGQGERNIPFGSFVVSVQKDDVIYLVTDGFADQFGGPKGKKFKHKNLVELLKKVCSDPFDTQKEKLIAALNEWKGSLEQVDDILIVGVRVG